MIFVDLTQMRSALDEKKISAAELTKHYLDRIEKTDSKINSYITVCAESALKDAEAAQKLIDEKKSAPLTGIPMSVKDNICTYSLKTT